MATTSGSLTTQLQNKLSDENVPLHSRLEVAFTVFSSSEIPLVQKEEYVLTWVLQILSKCEDNDKELLYSFLLKCFQSKRFQNFNGNMKTTVIEDLLSALKYVKKSNTSLKVIIRQCCVEIFGISFFQRWFMCDPENVCRTVSYYLKSITDLDSACDFINVIDQFLYVHKMSLLKGELRTNFIKDVFKPICEALCNIPESDRKLHFQRAVYCCREVIFYEPKFFDDYIMICKSKEEEPNQDVKWFRKRIKHLPMKENKDIVEISYCVFLRCVISKYPEENDKILRVFVSLFPPLGVVVNGIISIEMNPVTNWDINDSYDIIQKLIDILDGSKVPLTCQVEDVTLQTWFTSLVIGLANIDLSKNLLRMIKKVYEFNPLVIEPSCKVITMLMLQEKEVEVKADYVELVRSVLYGSAKIQRLQKFIALFLENMHEYMRNSFCYENLLVTDVLPEEIYDDLTSAFSALPSMQVLVMLRTFIFYLQRDCVNELESNADQALIIKYGINCELLTILLSSANMVDHSVPENVKSKYKQLLEDLQPLLKIMGDAFKDIHDDQLMIPFLKLCKSFGDIKLLFREYDGLQIVAPMAVDLEPTNISYVHNYLDHEDWGKIALSVEEHEDCEAAGYFYELLIQKVSALSQVEEGSEGPGTQVARYLLSSADAGWLWEKVLTLAPRFHTPELTKLIHRIVKYHGDDQSRWLPLLKEEALSENRCLVLGLSLCLMYRAGKRLEGEEGVSRKVVSLLPPESLLDYELSQLIVDDEELKEAVLEPLEEVASVLNENLPLLHTPSEAVPNISLFEVPARLPLHHLSGISQSCVLLSAAALLYDLPPGSPADMLLLNLILKIMDGPEKGNPDLLKEVSLDSFLRFIAMRGKEYRGQRKLMKRICAIAFRSKKSAKELIKEVAQPSASDAWVTALVIDSLVQLKKKYIGSKDIRKPLERKKCLDGLMDALLPVLTGELPSVSHLYTYTVLFSYTLRYLSTYRQHFSKLLPYLHQYTQLAVEDHKEGERLIESLVEHRSELAEELPATLVLSAFHQMKVQVLPPTESNSHLLFSAATLPELKTILTEMVDQTKVTEVEDGKVGRLLLLWSHLLSGLLSHEKSRERDAALLRLMESAVSVSRHWSEGSAQHLVLPLTNIISISSKNSRVILGGGAVDCYLELLGVVPLNPGDILFANLGPLLDALTCFFRFRQALLADRLPAFLQRYRRCLTALPLALPQTASYSDVNRAVPLANKMERLATSMVKRSKDFSRLAPYLIADLLNVFQHHSLPQQVKFAYDNVVNAFLSISDKHAITFLKGILPSGQQELFNGIFENFNKFHRFVGKV